MDSGALVAQALAEAQLLVPVQALLLARPPVLAHLVVDSALLLDLLSRQLSSAAMARSSP